MSGGEKPGRFRPHRAGRIVETVTGCGKTLIRRVGEKSDECLDAHRRVRVREASRNGTDVLRGECLRSERFNSCRPDNAGPVKVVGQSNELGELPGLPVSRLCEDFTIVGVSRTGSPPLIESNCRPVLIFVGVAFRAGIGGVNFCGNVRTRNTNAVIATGIHSHVGRRWHVALDAASPRAADGMKVVSRGVIGIGLVAADTERIARRDELH